MGFVSNQNCCKGFRFKEKVEKHLAFWMCVGVWANFFYGGKTIFVQKIFWHCLKNCYANLQNCFARLPPININFFPFLAAGFCPKSVAFAWKIIALPESGGKGCQPPAYWLGDVCRCDEVWPVPTGCLGYGWVGIENQAVSWKIAIKTVCVAALETNAIINKKNS